MKKLSILFVSFLLFFICVWGNEKDSAKIEFTLILPDSVEVGKAFRMIFEVNTDEPGDVKFPDFKGLEILTGPSTSSSVSTTIMNGKVTKDVKISYTFIVVAEKEGKFTVDPASIIIAGKKYKTKKATVTVKKEIGEYVSPDRNKKEQLPRNKQQPQQKKQKEPDGAVFI